MNPVTIPYRDIQQPDGVIRLEYFHDIEPDYPVAYATFQRRMSVLQQEYASWATIVLDSATFCELVARKRHEKVLNPMTKFAKGTDTRQWFAGSTDDLEEMLLLRFGALPMNVVLIAHTAESKNMVSGEILHSAALPGRLAKRAGASYQEQYYAKTIRDENGRLQHILQTANDGKFAATTHLNAPDPCWPTYDWIFSNWTGTRLPIHVMVFGDYGTGKSTFARSFPKPMLVFCFDPFGKDFPYFKNDALQMLPEENISELQTYGL